MYGAEGLAAARQLARERAGARREDETDVEYEARLADVRPGHNASRPVTDAERRGEYKRGKERT